MIIDVVLNALPHYRGGLVAELERAPGFSFNWVIGESLDTSSRDTPEADVSVGSRLRVINHVIRLGKLGQHVVWQSGVVKRAFLSTADVAIFTGDAHFVSTWLAAAIYRLRGAKVLMWTHGWIRRDHGLKRWARLFFYNMSDGLLLYNNRSARLAVAHGFKKSVFVIYNSNGAVVREVPPAANDEDREGLQRWIIVGRLVENKGFETAFHAAHYLGELGRELALTVVGDGPFEKKLRALAASLSIRADFVGSVYHQEEINRYLDEADVLISPFNVGLSAMQALARGVPVATSRDDDVQGPEAEAVIHGVTGVRFDPSDLPGMAEGVWNFVASCDRSSVFERCVSEYQSKWTPEHQAHQMLSAVGRIRTES